MTGTFVNAGAILAGGLIGLAAGRRLPERVKTIPVQALGLSRYCLPLCLCFAYIDPLKLKMVITKLYCMHDLR